MITGFAIRNFKSLAQVPPVEGGLVPFGPINVVIGPNGCGKSSLLQAIDFLRAFFRSSVEVYLQEKGWDYRDLPNLRQTSRAIRWELRARLDANEEGLGDGDYHYLVTLQPRKHLGIGEERLRYIPRGGTEHDSVLLLNRRGRSCTVYDLFRNRSDTKDIPRLPASIMSTWTSPKERMRYVEALHFRDWVNSFRSYLILDPKVLRAPSRGQHEELGPSGEHLASILGRLRDSNRPAFDRLVRRIRQLFPNQLSDVTVLGRGWGWRTIGLHESNGSTVVFNSQQISDGVLRLLAITSLVYLVRIPGVITCEEPENGVHPQLLREVVQILRELTQRKPPNRCQVFLTTHSPTVLDEFIDHPEQVYCMERPAPKAGAILYPLSASRQLQAVRKVFDKSLGEAWVSGLIGGTRRAAE